MITATVVGAGASALGTTDGRSASLHYEGGQARGTNNLKIYVNSRSYEGEAFIHNGTTYVGIRQFSMLLGAESVSWEQSTREASVSAEGIDIKVKNGANYMEANGRCLWLEHGNIIKSGTMYVPIRVICKVFGYGVEWEGKTRTVTVTKVGGVIEGGESYYDGDSVLWLSRIIHAEAEGESLLGKIAVGNVVLNRMSSPLFPNTIYGVIFDKKNGVQFTPTANGAIYNTPSADSVTAAKLCLEGVNILPGALFFVNVKTATDSWVSDNRECITVIGNHSFFA